MNPFKLCSQFELAPLRDGGARAVFLADGRGGLCVQVRAALRQGLTLDHYSAQPKPFWSHLPVSLCLIDWGKIMRPTYPTKCAYAEQNSGRV
jgi:hypothetical protein